ncbi:MAG: hypothetical protein K9J12_07650 [Melioribacteraceae bacterium]|nr:hypothetical protein [Melioribacteraceae bacterium]MCF8265475.1 hypothetical protein [Melioribacteraceae bacterium]MCF8431106.1 hypothetical protein [Melioribacteraceae bacterium]
MKVFLTLIASLIVIALFTLGAGKIAESLQVSNEVEELFSSTSSIELVNAQSEKFKSLPLPVRRYLLTKNIDPTKQIQTMRMKQEGRYKLRFNKEYLDMTAELYVDYGDKEFIWFANVTQTKPFFTTVIDNYFKSQGGRARTKLMAIVRTRDDIGISVNKANMLQMLADLMWNPSFLLSSSISWDSIDDFSARCTLMDEFTNVAATFFFDTDNELVRIEAQRPEGTKEDFKRRLWEVRVLEHGNFDGNILPYRVEYVYFAGENEYPYMEIKVNELEYNSREDF